MEKQCLKCLEHKNMSEFSLRSKESGKTNPWCKKCTKEYRNDYYETNKDRVGGKDKINKTERLERNRQYIWDYYKTHPCIDCGESDPIVLQFDHRGDSVKFKNISNLVSGRYSLEIINKEIDKCDVRCANCHLRKTAIDQDWYKNTIK